VSYTKNEALWIRLQIRPQRQDEQEINNCDNAKTDDNRFAVWAAPLRDNNHSDDEPGRRHLRRRRDGQDALEKPVSDHGDDVDDRQPADPRRKFVPGIRRRRGAKSVEYSYFFILAWYLRVR